MQSNIEMSSIQPPRTDDFDDGEFHYIAPPPVITARYKCYPVQNDDAATYLERLEMGDVDAL